MLKLGVVAAIVFGAVWLLGSKSVGKKKKRQVRRAVPRRWGRYYNDESYESPLGLVDDPDDEWMEYAIMHDLIDGEW